MSKVIDYLLRACDGIESYLSSNHYFVLLVVVLLTLWLTNKKQADEKQNRLLVLSFKKI